MVQNKDPLPAADQAYRWVKSRITTLPRDHDLFITEAEIAEQSGLSRTPVREALMRLDGEGFLRRIRYKGAYIPKIDDSDVSSLVGARKVIERWSVSRLGSWSPASVANLADALRNQESQEKVSAFVDSDVSFHQTIALAGANLLLSDFYDTLADRQARIGIDALSSGDQRRDEVIEEHRSILEAIQQRDVDAAVEAVSHHLDRTLEAVLRHH